MGLSGAMSSKRQDGGPEIRHSRQPRIASRLKPDSGNGLKVAKQKPIKCLLLARSSNRAALLIPDSKIGRGDRWLKELKVDARPKQRVEWRRARRFSKACTKIQPFRVAECLEVGPSCTASRNITLDTQFRMVNYSPARAAGLGPTLIQRTRALHLASKSGVPTATELQWVDSVHLSTHQDLAVHATPTTDADQRIITSGRWKKED